jgi:S-adenosylmethionine decarboxylase proenzyme
LNDLDFVRETIIKAADAVGATIIGESFHSFEPQGVTGVLAIAESHISIHTWPEYGYAAADIFTCSSSIEPMDAAQLLIDSLESKRHEISEIQRGVESNTSVSHS